MTGAARTAVIPAAGRGTRMLPATKCVPKELLPLGGRPVIHHIVEEGVAAGVDEFVLVVRPGDRRLEEYFAPSPELDAALPPEGPLRDAYRSTLADGIRLRSVEQAEPKGLGHAVLQAREAVGDRAFAVMLPDMLFLPAERGLPAMRELPAGAGGLLLMEVDPESVSSYGIAELEGDGPLRRIADIVEKPPAQDAPSRWAAAGRYVFGPGMFRLLERLEPGAGGEIQLTDAIREVARISELLAVPLDGGRCLDCGTPNGYAAAFAALA